MYENFAFADRGQSIVGYHFPCENAEAVMAIIHGVGEHAGRYSRMAAHLRERGIAVVAMDLRGHGCSAGIRGDAAPRQDILGDVDALLAYAEKFYPGRPITLYGHSMGGNICLDYRARGTRNDVPEKYIVSAPWIQLVMKIPGLVYAIGKGASKVMPRMAISQTFAEEDLGYLEYVQPYADDPLVHDQLTLRCAVDCIDVGNALYQGTNEDDHRADGKPFLLMHGDADKICDIAGSRQVASRYEGEPWFTYIEWPGYCHEIHNGGPEVTGDEVLETIGKFIQG